MPDPGYGPNGERLDASGLVSWQAAAPPVPVNEADDYYGIYPLGVVVIPFIDQDDDDAWESIYLGGVP